MRRLWKEHVFTKILCLSLICALVPIAIVDYIWYRNTSATLTDNARQSSTQLLNQIASSMQQSVYNVNTIALSVILDPEFNDILESASAVEEPSVENLSSLYTKLSTAKSLNDSIAAITILSKDMAYAVSTAGERLEYDALFAQQWYIDFVRTGVNRSYTSIHTCSYIDRINTSTYTILFRVWPNNDHLKPAYLVIEIYASPYIRLLQDIKSDSVVVSIQDQDGQTNYSTNDPSLTGKDAIVISRDVRMLNWTLSMSIKRSALLNNTYAVRRLSSAILFAVMLIMIVFSIIFSLYITRPVTALSKATRKVREGDLSIQVPIATQDEIGRMSDDFNAMIHKISTLMEDVRISEHDKYNAKVQALQAQINPHFLYNTLNVIRWLSMMGENDKINQLVISLVHMLEYTKEDLDTFIPVEREIEHVRHYVNVMSYRYEDKFIYEECIDEAAKSCYTIRFILQPLVENAIFHGIDPSEKKGTITLSVTAKNERVMFAVSDDGVGLDLEHNRHRFFSGYGISNVNERLRMHFGNESMLNIVSTVGKGTTVYFSIPLLTDIPEHPTHQP